MRIAFCGASGTGKTTLAKWVAETYGVPFNPVGSRSVAKNMGFDNPYDVDKAGKRAEFQQRLLAEKIEWESQHDTFVSDRTTMDNLLYTMIHDVYSIDDTTIDQAVQGMARYTLVWFCPIKSFLNLGGDPNRVSNKAYHRLYDVTMPALLSMSDTDYDCMRVEGFEARTEVLKFALEKG